jgi:hypothetical protein
VPVSVNLTTKGAGPEVISAVNAATGFIESDNASSAADAVDIENKKTKINKKTLLLNYLPFPRQAYISKSGSNPEDNLCSQA